MSSIDWRVITVITTHATACEFLFGLTGAPTIEADIPRKSKDQTLPIGSRESFNFTWIILKTILCLVLDFHGMFPSPSCLQLQLRGRFVQHMWGTNQTQNFDWNSVSEKICCILGAGFFTCPGIGDIQYIMMEHILSYRFTLSLSSSFVNHPTWLFPSQDDPSAGRAWCHHGVTWDWSFW